VYVLPCCAVLCCRANSILSDAEVICQLLVPEDNTNGGCGAWGGGVPGFVWRSMGRMGQPIFYKLVCAAVLCVLCCRADSIISDAEVIRQVLVPEDNTQGRWSILGQSFGGFCAFTYLSMAPQGVRKVPSLSQGMQSHSQSEIISCVGGWGKVGGGGVQRTGDRKKERKQASLHPIQYMPHSKFAP
jgi:hypothetical protein